MFDSSLANISAMLYYDFTDVGDGAKKMPYYPNCNMRTLSELNMTIKVNAKQQYTMEQIVKNHNHEGREYDLRPPIAVMVYQVTAEKTDESVALYSAGIIKRNKKPTLLRLVDRWAIPVTKKALHDAAVALGKHSDLIFGEWFIIS